MSEEHVLRITHLRDCLGWVYQQVARTGEPIIIQRYSAQDVVMAPLWQWRFFQKLRSRHPGRAAPVGREPGR